MESVTKPVRLTLPLLKAPITNITPQGFTIRLGAHYGSPTTITVKARTEMMDIRDGDVITVYTEVLLKAHRGEG